MTLQLTDHQPFVPKVQVTLRLEAGILDYYRATGRGWQTRINDDLARVVQARRTDLVARHAVAPPVRKPRRRR